MYMSKRVSHLTIEKSEVFRSYLVADDRTASLSASILSDLSEAVPLPFTLKTISEVSARLGAVYVLVLDGQDVFISYCRDATQLRRKLNQQYDSVHHRIGVDPKLVSIKAAYIPDDISQHYWSALKGIMRTLPKLCWNKAAFGAGDPGHNRERQEPACFDREHPINIDYPITPSVSRVGEVRAVDVLSQLKSHLPYVLRYETERKSDEAGTSSRAQSDLLRSKVSIPADNLTVRLMLKAVLDSLPRVRTHNQ